MHNERYPIKVLVNDFLRYEKGDISDVIESADLVLTIQETFPLFILTDNYYFMSAVLTRELWEKLRKQTTEKNNIKLSDLKNVRMRITKF